MTRRRLLAAWVVAGALLGLPASAGATTVEAVDAECVGGPCVRVTVGSRPEERNDMTIRAEGGAIVVTDAAATLVAERGCVRGDDGSVRCAQTRPITHVNVTTGDEDDVVRAELPGVYLVGVYLAGGNDRYEAGADNVEGHGAEGDDEMIAVAGIASFDGDEGDDVLVGGPEADELDGDLGRDRMTGGAGNDTLDASDGDEVDERPSADELDGGAGRDRATYAQRERSVRVDLADPGPDGSPGERDVLRSIEDLEGGRGDDRLYGDAGPNRLYGEPGADELRGRGGADLLALEESSLRDGPQTADGGAGNDVVRGKDSRLVGGPGDDVLDGGGTRSSTACGPGRDVIRPRPGPALAMAADCERWAFAWTDGDVVLDRPVLAGGAVRETVPCPRADGFPCTLILRVATPAGRRLAEARGRAASGTSRALSARARAGALRLPLRVVVGVRQPGGRFDARAIALKR